MRVIPQVRARITVDPVLGALGACVLRHFLGKQREQHFVAVLVAGGGKLTLGYQPSIERDIFFVYETFHFVLPNPRLLSGTGECERCIVTRSKFWPR